MAIFPDLNRKNTEPKSIGGSEYSFLNRTSIKKYTFVRKLINDWFEEYPDEHKSNLKPRLTSEKDLEFYAAFFELYIFKLLRQIGYSVKIHPKVKGTNKQPDFLAKGAKEHFYIEALTTNLKSNDEEAKKRIVNYILDRIHRLKIENYFLDINISGKLTKPQAVSCS